MQFICEPSIHKVLFYLIFKDLSWNCIKIRALINVMAVFFQGLMYLPVGTGAVGRNGLHRRVVKSKKLGLFGMLNTAGQYV